MTTVSLTPGILRAISDSLCMAASVRSMLVASGICMLTIRYPWSWSGMNPVGTRLNPT